MGPSKLPNSGGIGVLSILIALPAILLGIAFASGNPPTKSVVYKSPGGQEATLKYSAGFRSASCGDIRRTFLRTLWM
jgi:hypothetical protein